jgi:peptide/nickel transport system permease protein
MMDLCHEFAYLEPRILLKEDDTLTDVDQKAELVRAGAHVESRWGMFVHFARRYPLGLLGAIIVGVFVLMAIFADVIAPHDPVQTNAPYSLMAPNAHFWLGGDMMGRDLLSRLIHGARISLAVGLTSTFVGGFIGVALGLACGFLMGWFDLIVQRISDVMQALPLLVLALVMAASLGPSLQNTIIAISIPLIPDIARVVRSSTLTFREMPFTEAARAAGMTEWRIAIRHVLPNMLAPLIVLATAQLGSAILTEASLSFLGLGVPAPHPSWGRMLSESAAEYVRQAPWLVIFPGLFISAMVFGSNLMGDALRDMMDPRQRR